MRNFLIRLAINAVAIAIIAALVPGIRLLNDSLGTLIIIGLVFGIINALVKPIVQVLTCPFILLTLGLFTLVINALMLLLTASLLPGRFQIDGFFPAFIGGILMSILSFVLERLLGVDDDDDKRKREPDVIVMERRR